MFMSSFCRRRARSSGAAAVLAVIQGRAFAQSVLPWDGL